MYSFLKDKREACHREIAAMIRFYVENLLRLHSQTPGVKNLTVWY